MTAVQVEAFTAPEPSDPAELIPELTRLALASACKAEFRGRALALLSRALPFDRAVWEEVAPFGEFQVLFPGVSLVSGGAARGPASVVSDQDVGGDAAEAVDECVSRAEGPRAILRLDLERFGRTRAVLTLQRGGGAFGARDVDWLRALLPTLILADEGTAVSAGPSPALTPRETDLAEDLRLRHTNRA